MTSKNRSLRPSPALVLSCVALVMALTGSALAVGVAKNSVRSAQIVDGTVRTVDLGRNAVKAEKIAPNAVGATQIAADAVGAEEVAADAIGSAEVAPDSLTAADLGPASVSSSEVADESLGAQDLGPNSVGTSEIAAGSVRAAELGAIVQRASSAPIAAGANGSVSVSCAAGEQVISGGGQPANFGVEMTSSRPSGNGWLYQAKNANGSASTITAYALCLAA